MKERLSWQTIRRQLWKGFEVQKNGYRKNQNLKRSIQRSYTVMKQRSNSSLLSIGRVHFDRSLLDIESIDPFRYVTITSVCTGVYKTKFPNKYYIATLDKPDTSSTDVLECIHRLEGYVMNGRAWKLLRLKSRKVRSSV